MAQDEAQPGHVRPEKMSRDCVPALENDIAGGPG